jgi:hypothetical protein
MKMSLPFYLISHFRYWLRIKTTGHLPSAPNMAPAPILGYPVNLGEHTLMNTNLDPTNLGEMQDIAAGALEIGHILHWTTIQYSLVPYRHTMQGIAAGALIMQGIAAQALIAYRYTMQGIAAELLIPHKHTRFKSPMMETENMLGSTHQHHMHIIMQCGDAANATTTV